MEGRIFTRIHGDGALWALRIDELKELGGAEKAANPIGPRLAQPRGCRTGKFLMPGNLVHLVTVTVIKRPITLAK